MKLEDYAAEELGTLEAAHLLRSPRSVDGAQGPEITIEGRSVLCLCSNNYLGLADHPALRSAVREALDPYGFGSCASRHISGSMRLHLELEERVGRFVGQSKALLFSTGFNANVGTIQALAGPRSLVMSDALNHASIIDGCRLARATTRVFRHLDLEHLESLLRAERHKHPTALVVTESLFSMDGDVAPLAQLRALCDRYDAALVVDDAHALGVLGPSGRGLCAEPGVNADVITGTFGKAFGCTGAFVAGSERVIRLIENRARCYVFSTAPSPAIAAAALAAFALVEGADDRRRALRERSHVLRSGLMRLGFQVPAGESHIIPVLLGAAEHAVELSTQLFERGVFVHGIRPPTVPDGTSRLRVTAMATHEPHHIAAALEAFDGLQR